MANSGLGFASNILRGRMMKKLSSIFPWIVVFLFAGFCVVTLLAMGCALSQPHKTIVLNLAAQNCGFLLAQEKPELAQDILHASNCTLDMESADFTKFTFQAWARMVIERLKPDPFLQMNFKELIKLVKIEIELSEDQQEIVALTFSVIQNFIIGIEAGKQ